MHAYLSSAPEGAMAFPRRDGGKVGRVPSRSGPVEHSRRIYSAQEPPDPPRGALLHIPERCGLAGPPNAVGDS